MSHLITIAIAVPSAIVCFTLIEWGIRLLGPRNLKEHYRQRRIEEVHVLRTLGRWQVVLIEGVLKFGLYMALAFSVVDFIRSRYETGYIFNTEDVLRERCYLWFCWNLGRIFFLGPNLGSQVRSTRIC